MMSRARTIKFVVQTMVMVLCTLAGAQWSSAATTGTWAVSGTGGSATAAGVVVTVTATGASANAATATMNTGLPDDYWTNPYGSTIVNAPALDVFFPTPGASGTVTFGFSKPVNNPVLHIGRLGAFNSSLGSTIWTLGSSSAAGGPVSMSVLSSNVQFSYSSTAFHGPTSGASVSDGRCLAGVNATKAMGCGSVELVGTGITSVTFNITSAGASSGDGVDLALSIPDTKVVIKESTVGGTGSFSFTGTNGITTASLDTSASNPSLSAVSTVTNQTAALSITQASNSAFRLTSATCVDQNSTTVASSLSANTLTIAAADYPVSGATITCTFLNTKIAVLPVADTSTAVQQGIGGTAIANVASNDTIDGAPADISPSGNATIGADPSNPLPAGISLNTSTGAVTVAGTVSSGLYDVWYQLCDKSTPTHCATVKDQVTVNVPGLIFGSGGYPQLCAHASASATSTIAGVPNGGLVIYSSVTTNTATLNGINISRVDSGNRTMYTTPGDVIGLANLGHTNPAQTTWVFYTGSFSTTITFSKPINSNYIIGFNDVDAGAHAVVTAYDASGARLNMSGWTHEGGQNAVGNTVTVSSSNVDIYGNGINNSDPITILRPAPYQAVGSIVISYSGEFGYNNLYFGYLRCEDHSDAPASYGDAIHTAHFDMRLGSTISTELSTLASAAATGDGASDDGIAAFPVLYNNATSYSLPAVSIAAQGSGTLHGWIDFNKNGSFDASEHASVAVVNGVPAGNLTWTGLPALTAGNTFARFRLTTDASVIASTPSGAATNGEVEDYQVAISVPSILPVVDTATDIIAGTGGTAIANVAANDTVNGAAATLGSGGNATVGPDSSNPLPTGITLDTTSGAVNVSTGVAPGTYPVWYKLCDKNTPVNCATVQDSVTVKAAILPVVDTATDIIAGTGGTAIANVAANDTVNGVAATLGSSGNATVGPDPSNPLPTGITLDTTSGAVIVGTSVAPGTYAVWYKLCDKNTPVNCATVQDSVTVKAEILPVTESGTAVSGTANPSALANIGANDKVNGVAADISATGNATLATSGSWPAGITLDPATGIVSTTAAVQPGTYHVTYQLCDKSSPVNCATMPDTIVVSGDIVPVTESGTAVSGTANPSALSNIAANDKVNGVAADISATGNATIATSGSWPTGITLDPATGIVSTAATVQPGTYFVDYKLCDKSSPTPNCATMTDKIVVSGDIVPVTESGTAVSGTANPSALSNIAANDKVNGAAADISATGNATLATSGAWPAGITLDPATGIVSTTTAVQPNTYLLDYKLCDKSSPTPNCATTTDKIVVSASMHAVVDSAAVLTAGTGGVAIANVVANDTVNGAAAILGAGGNATVGPDPSNPLPAGITINAATGAVTADTTVTPGTYDVWYKLCDRNAPVNCTTVKDQVTVNAVIQGTIFHDSNGNGALDGGEPGAGAGYTVELTDASGASVIAQTVTGSGGSYAIAAPVGANYKLVFKNAAGVTLGQVTGVDVMAGGPPQTFNEPIDPSGIVYNSLTRQAVAGVALTMTDAHGTPLPAVCLISAAQQGQVTLADGAYRFDLIPGADAACPASETEYKIATVNPAGFMPGFSTNLPPHAGALDATTCPGDAVPGGSCQVSGSAVQPSSGPAVYYVEFLLAQHDPHVVNNHIPLDPVTAGAAAFSKVALKTEITRGESVPYVITAKNVTVNPLTVADTPPPGFDYVAGSAKVNGVAATPSWSGSQLLFPNLAPDGTGLVKIELTMVANASVKTGPATNWVSFVNPATGAQIGKASATVTVMAEPVFDCSEIIGKVFDDKNRNGYQDQGEPGLPGVRIATVKGQLVTTDKFGRFHVACADIPNQYIGSNFLMKLDTRTLPTGYRLTTENPRDVRLTRGTMTKLNFGAAITRVVKLDLNGLVFNGTTTELQSQWQQQLAGVVATLAAEPSTLQLNYHLQGEGTALANQRLAAVQKIISKMWKDKGNTYALPIETRVLGIAGTNLQ